MRNAFADEMTKLALLDRRLILLSGDIGTNFLTNLRISHRIAFTTVVLLKET